MTTFTTTMRLHLTGEEGSYVGWDECNDYKIVHSDKHRARVNLFDKVVRHVRHVLVATGRLAPPIVARHNSRLTFGMELEMVVVGWSSEKTGFNAVEGSFNRIKWAGEKSYECQVYHGTGSPDRSKFLIMRDGSINSRVCVKPWLKIPSSPRGQTTGNSTVEERRLVANKILAPKSPEEERKAWWSRGSNDTYYLTREENVTKWLEEYLHDLSDPCFILGAPVEMCTPILTQDTYEPAIESVLSHLTEDLALHFNESTGLHVHVGCGKGNSWKLEELQAIAKAVFLFEDVIDLMHAAHRVEENWMIASNRWNPAVRGLTIEEAFSVIDATLSTQEFLNVVGNRKWHKYNFTTNDMYGTIEFRQSEAHGNPKKAVEWIRFISCFVSAALGAAKWEWAMWAEQLGGEAVGNKPRPERRLSYLHLSEDTWERFGIPSHLRRLIPGMYEEHTYRVRMAKLSEVYDAAAACAPNFIRNVAAGDRQPSPSD